MRIRRHSGHSYRSDDLLIRSRKKNRRIGRYLLPALIVLIAAAVYHYHRSESLTGFISYLPFPKNLVAMHFLHNGQDVLLKPDTQLVINPRDSIQLLEVQTDGWVSWGTKAMATDLEVEALREQPLVMKELFPQESFEVPKDVEIQVQRWDMPLGKVSLLIRLDARDWLQKAHATADLKAKTSYLEKALQESPGNTLVKTQLAGLYFEDKKYDDAARLYDEINATGKSRSILERLLSVYQTQSKVEKALVTHLELLRLTEDPEVFKGLLKYLQQNKSKEDAGKFLERHQQGIPKAFNNAVLLYLADLHTQNKDWSKAATTYEKVIKSGVKDPDVLYNLAVTYEKSDDQDRAIKALEGYLQKNSGDIKSWMQLAELQEKKGDLSRARATYEKVLQKNPQQNEALVRLVAILEKSNDKKALQNAYEKLARSQPKNKTVLFNLGVLYYEAKDWDNAAKSFESIASQDAKDLESRKYLLDIYKKVKNHKSELNMLQNLVEIDPKNLSYYDALFSAYDEEKDYKTIVSVFSKAARENNDSVAMHRYLLYGLLKTGDNAGALKELEQLIRLQPKEKKHLRQAANLYERAGQYPQALKKLEQLLKVDPKNKEAKEDYLRLKLLALRN